MSAVFTEGPWEAKAVGHDLRVYAGSYKICGGVDHNGNPENQANARLIAAAPELYEALERIGAEVFPHPNSAHVYIDTIRAVANRALAKARDGK